MKCCTQAGVEAHEQLCSQETKFATQWSCVWGESANLQVMVLKAGNIGPSLNSQTGSAAELGVPAERCLHTYFLECEEMNSSLSAAVAAPDVMPSSIWHI